MKISILLQALTGTFVTDMNRAARDADKSAKKMRRDVERELAAMKATASKAGKAIGLAIAAGIAGSAYAVKKAIDEMGDVADTSQKLGIPVEDLTALRYAAKLAGVEAGALDSAMGKLAKNIYAAAEGGKAQVAAFNALGVSFQNADGSLRPVRDVLLDLTDKFSSFRDGTEKTALSMQLFGRSGKDLIPLMNQGRDAVQGFIAEAKDLGLVFSTETAQAAENLGDNFDKIGLALKGAVFQAAKELTPVLTDLTNQIIEAVKDPSFRGDFANAIRVIGEVAIGSVQGIINLANGLGYLVDEVKEFFGVIRDNDAVRISDQLLAAKATLDAWQRTLESSGPLLKGWAQRNVDEASAKVQQLTAALEALQNRTAQSGKPSGGSPTGSAPAGPLADPPRVPTGPTDAEKEATRRREKEQKAAAAREIKMAEAIERERQRLADESTQAIAEIRSRGLTEEQEAWVKFKEDMKAIQDALNRDQLDSAGASELRTKVMEEWKQAQKDAHQEAIDALYDGLLTEEELLARSYDKRRDAIMQSTEITERERQDLLRRLEEQYQEEAQKRSKESNDVMTEFAVQAAHNIQDAFADFLFDPFEGGLKGMIKNFANMIRRMMADLLASALLKKIGQLLKASSGGGGGFWGAVADVFIGPKDAGGSIPSGKVALVGERRPEFVRGPATVTGGAQTASMLSRGVDAARSSNNVSILNAIDPAFIKDYLASSAGDEVFVNLVSRNSRRVRAVMGG